jgi:hypothetical protein
MRRGFAATPRQFTWLQLSTLHYYRMQQSRTFSSMDSESLKSCSMASTSASLGVLFRNRPKVRWARCMVKVSATARKGAGSRSVRVGDVRMGAEARLAGGCAGGKDGEVR